MIKEFDEVWNNWGVEEWDDYKYIFKRLNIPEIKESKELIREFAKGMYSAGFGDGYTDARHDYYTYKDKLRKSLLKFFKEYMKDLKNSESDIIKFVTDTICLELYEDKN